MKDRTVMVNMVKDGRVFVQPFSTTENGLDTWDGLPTMLPSIDDPNALGLALVAALDKSNHRILPAVDARAPSSADDFLAFTGFKTYLQYVKGVCTVSLSAEYDHRLDTVSIVPMSNTREGFFPLSTETVVADFESPEQLGRAVQEAMKKATRRRRCDFSTDWVDVHGGTTRFGRLATSPWAI